MNKILVIAEKPSVGRDIGKVLKCNKKGDGYIFSDEYIVSWAIGHLVGLKNPEDYDKSLKSWKVNTLPIIPDEISLKPIKKTEGQLKILKKLMNSSEVSEIVCATDSGREGELIFRYIYQIIKCEKPVKRLWISSMTDTSIKEGFKNLKDSSLYDDLYKSAKCRSEADWLVGINATRAYTLKYDILLSIGRVQTPTLSIICQRQKEIDSFESKEYYELKAEFEKYSGLWFDKNTLDTKISDKEKGEEILKKVEGKAGVVENIEVEEKRQLSPALFDLTELQRECNRKFAFSAQKTLSIAQDLYEKRKLITYPRTDSRYLSDDMIPKLKSTLQKVSNVEDYKEFAQYILNMDKLPITKRIVDNSKITDHHAIIPTDVNINTLSLSKDEFKVFDIIVKRFLSVFYPAYIYNVTKITTNVLEELFLTKGNTVVSLGYMEIYKNDTKKEDTENQTIPKVIIGEKYSVTNIELIKKKTKPPKNYTEATILSAMENAGRFVEDENLKEQLKASGIGTPATRASIIERLIEVGYIVRKGKSLIPTEKGMKLIEVVPVELKSPETTGRWEKGLDSISKGKMDTEKFMNSIKRYVCYITDESKKNTNEIIFPPEEKTFKGKSKSLGKCPACEQGYILENSKAFFCTRWKAGCKFTMWKNNLDRYGVSFDSKMAKQIIKDKVIKDIEITLPQTMEKCKADLIFKNEKMGVLELINLVRI